MARVGTEGVPDSVTLGASSHIATDLLAGCHLTASQKAAIAAELLPQYEAEAKERLKTSSGGNEPRPVEKMPQAEQGKARDMAASAVGVNPRYVSDAKKLKEESPKEFEAVKSGGKTAQGGGGGVETKNRSPVSRLVPVRVFLRKLRGLENLSASDSRGNRPPFEDIQEHQSRTVPLSFASAPMSKSLIESAQTVDDVAKRYKVSYRTICRWVMAGRLPGWFSFSRERYFFREDLDLFDSHVVRTAAHKAGGGDPDELPTPGYTIPPRKACRLPDEPKVA